MSRMNTTNIYPLDEAMDLLLRTDTGPTIKHIYILSMSLAETKSIMTLAKSLNYVAASTAWENVLELLKRGGQ